MAARNNLDVCILQEGQDSRPFHTWGNYQEKRREQRETKSVAGICLFHYVIYTALELIR